MATRAGDWFDAWQQDCITIPDSLNLDAYQQLFAERENSARNQGQTPMRRAPMQWMQQSTNTDERGH
eukprot:121593-Pyramimonas_sp.AAC.1